MVTLTFLLSAAKAAGTVVSGMKTASAVKEWLLRDKRDPLRKALDQTISKYESTFPNIANQLVALFRDERFITDVGSQHLWTPVTQKHSPLRA